jgi:hypothetical protein
MPTLTCAWGALIAPSDSATATMLMRSVLRTMVPSFGYVLV